MLAIEEDVVKGLLAGGTVIGLILKVVIDLIANKKEKPQSAGDLSPAEWEARIFNIVRSATNNDAQEIKEAIDMLRLLADSLERNIDRLSDRRLHPRD